jgi:Flp pilus assembly protein TadG
MRPSTRPVRRQHGAVAIVFGLTLVVLLTAGGLVLDLGHLYVLKSELQNGADSAALAGAKELNLAASGITAAETKAIAYAAKHKYNFGSTLTLTSAEVRFGTTPDGPWLSASAAAATPESMSFIKVDTGSKPVSTYLMQIAGIGSVATNGVAVAGRFVVNITPLALCAVSTTSSSSQQLKLTGDYELVEYGFRRGLSYNLRDMGPVSGSPSDPMLINPVDTPATGCNPAHSSAAFVAPFLCKGNSAVAHQAVTVFANTGASAGPVEKALNSRFNDFSGGTSCSASTAPPDRNIKEYLHNDAGSGGPATWMSSAPTQQSAWPIPPLTIPNHGVLWTHSRAVSAVASGSGFVAGPEFGVDRWPDLYDQAAKAAYPAAAGDTPYAQTSGNYFTSPSPTASAEDRRLMRMAIVNCSGVPAGAMSCRSLPVLGVGKFFLTRKVNLNGAPATQGVWVEFAGMEKTVPKSEIKLYR